MDYIQTLILAVVEGITEFLPISSTGHLILTSKILNIPQTEFVKTFEISIQLGAILSVVFLYGSRLLQDFNTLKRVIWVFLPTAFLGFLLYKIVKTFLIGNLMVTVWALILGGILMIILEKYFLKNEGKLKIKDFSLKKSLILGIIQTLAVIPGVSRSATTIFGGMYLGLSRSKATELSFMVALPVMAAATSYDLFKNFNSISSSDLTLLLLGSFFSFLTAVAAIKWLTQYVQHHSFVYFGIYRIVVGILFLINSKLSPI